VGGDVHVRAHARGAAELYVAAGARLDVEVQGRVTPEGADFERKPTKELWQQAAEIPARLLIERTSGEGGDEVVGIDADPPALHPKEGVLVERTCEVLEPRDLGIDELSEQGNIRPILLMVPQIAKEGPCGAPRCEIVTAVGWGVVGYVLEVESIPDEVLNPEAVDCFQKPIGLQMGLGYIGAGLDAGGCVEEELLADVTEGLVQPGLFEG